MMFVVNIFYYLIYFDVGKVLIDDRFGGVSILNGEEQSTSPSFC